MSPHPPRQRQRAVLPLLLVGVISPLMCHLARFARLLGGVWKHSHFLPCTALAIASLLYGACVTKGSTGRLALQRARETFLPEHPPESSRGHGRFAWMSRASRGADSGGGSSSLRAPSRCCAAPERQRCGEEPAPGPWGLTVKALQGGRTAWIKTKRTPGEFLTAVGGGGGDLTQFCLNRKGKRGFSVRTQ